MLKTPATIASPLVFLITAFSCMKCETISYANHVRYEIFISKTLTSYSGSYTTYQNGHLTNNQFRNINASINANFTAPSGEHLKLSAQISNLPAGDSATIHIYVNQQLVASEDSTNTAWYILN